MRLTLRTMLAYLDDILESSDSQDLAKKIEESEFASGLVHRIRDVSRRMRLGAPQLDGRGTGLDANTVAEYLDNTLPAERVPDFEKVCLESDMHLAEVASCHQILTMVLGEPAHVDPASRGRMYNLVHQGGPEHAHQAAGAPGPAPAAMVDASASAERKKHEVPEYLRDSRESAASGSGKGKLAVAALLVMAASLTAAGLYLYGPWQPGKKVADVGGGADDPAGANTRSPESIAPDKSTDTGTPTPRENADAGLGTDDTAKGDSAKGIVDDSGDGKSPDVIPPTNPDKTPVDEGNDKKTEKLPLDPPLPTPDKTPDKTTDKPPTPVPGPKGQVIPAGTTVGRYLTVDQLLVEQDPERLAWKRMAKDAPVATGRRLVALPTYRPQLRLTSGVNLYLVEGASVTAFQTGPSAPPGILVDSGRISGMMNDGGQSVELPIRWGSRQGAIVFADGKARAAFEVAWDRPIGATPKRDPGQIIARLYVIAGEVTFKGGKDGEQVVRAGETLTWIGDKAGAVAASGTLPNWIDPPQLSVLDRRASMQLAKAMKPGEMINIVLKELVHRGQQEVGLIGAQAAARVGQIGPLVSAIGNEMGNGNRDVLSWNWRTRYVEELIQTAHRGPARAALVRDALVVAKGETASFELYRMLWGYSAQDLKTGSADALVGYLEHDDLIFRSLAFYNLKQITGVSHSYHPEQASARRVSPVSYWKKRLDRGGIVHKITPSKSRRSK